MAVIVVANPKGGVGKSTLSTHVAACLAHQGRRVCLGDLDRQRSARLWLDLRPSRCARIEPWLLTPDDIRKPPKGMDDAVLDTPAGLHGKALGEVLALADKVIVPLQASVFDIHAAHDFFQDLLQRKRVAKLDVGVVGMRLRETTMAAEQLRQYLGQIPFEVIGALRDTQHYVQLCAHGLSLWDVAPSRVERDLAQWESLQRFLAPRVA